MVQVRGFPPGACSSSDESEIEMRGEGDLEWHRDCDRADSSLRLPRSCQTLDYYFHGRGNRSDVAARHQFPDVMDAPPSLIGAWSGWLAIALHRRRESRRAGSSPFDAALSPNAGRSRSPLSDRFGRFQRDG